MKRLSRLRSADELLALFAEDHGASLAVVKYRLAISTPILVRDGAGNCRGLFLEKDFIRLLRTRDSTASREQSSVASPGLSDLYRRIEALERGRSKKAKAAK